MVRGIGSGLPAQGQYFHDVTNTIAEYLGPRDVVNLSKIPLAYARPPSDSDAPPSDAPHPYLQDSLPLSKAIVERCDRHVREFDTLVGAIPTTDHGEPPVFVAGVACGAFRTLPPDARTTTRYDTVEGAVLSLEDDSRALAFPELAGAFRALHPAHRTIERYMRIADATGQIEDPKYRAMAESALATAFAALSPELRTPLRYRDIVSAATTWMSHDETSRGIAAQALVTAYRAMCHDPTISGRLPYAMIANLIDQIGDEVLHAEAMRAQAAAFAAQDPAQRRPEQYAVFERAARDASSDEARAHAALALASAYAALPPEQREPKHYDLIVDTVRAIRDETHLVTALPALYGRLSTLPDDRSVLEYGDFAESIRQIQSPELRALALPQQAYAFSALRPELRTLDDYAAIDAAVQNVRGTKNFAYAVLGQAIAFAALRPEDRKLDSYDAIVAARQGDHTKPLDSLLALLAHGEALAGLTAAYTPPSQLAKLLSLHQIPQLNRPLVNGRD